MPILNKPAKKKPAKKKKAATPSGEPAKEDDKTKDPGNENE